MPTRRMLVIVNPYATTMSVRLKQLVVYALQGALRGRGRRHAAQGARDRAVPRRRAARATTSSSRSAATAPSTRSRTGSSARGPRSSRCRAARRTCTAGCSASRPTSSTPRSTCSGSPTRWAPRPVDLARVNDRWFTFSAGAGLDATVVERVDRHPRLKARLGPWYYAQAATAVFLEKYVVNAAQGRRGRRAGEEHAGASRLRAERAALHVLPPRARSRSRPAPALDSGDLSAVVLARASALDLPTMAYRLLSTRAQVGRHRQARAFDGLDGLRVRSCRRAAGARPGRRRLHRRARGGGLLRPPRRACAAGLSSSLTAQPPFGVTR